MLGLDALVVLPHEPSPLTAICERVAKQGVYLVVVDRNLDKPVQSLDTALVEQLEHEIDAITDAIPPFRCFIVPGGSRGAALAHVCRTVCRRAERRIIALAEEAPVDAVLLSYVNRLSDFLFVLARKVNFSQDIEEKRVF